MKLLQKHWVLILIISIGLTLRLYRINLPLLDAKPHREIHTAEETRNLFYDKELLYPKAKLWADEPGYYLAEFPIYNTIVASIYSMSSGVNEVWGKLVSVGASIGVIIFFYLFIRTFLDSTATLVASGFLYLFSPQEIILSRTFQPDQLGLCLGMMSLYFFSRWIITQKTLYWIISSILFASTLLIKIQFFPFGFPMLFLAFNKWGLSVFTKPLLYAYGITLIPFLLWWRHIKLVYAQFPQLHSAALLQPTNWMDFSILLNIHWYINVFYDFAEQITTVPVFLLALVGLYMTQQKNRGLVFSWLAGLILYAFLFIGKIHFWYYQVPFLFPIVILAGNTIAIIKQKSGAYIRYPKLIIGVIILAAMALTGRPYLLRTYTTDPRHQAIITTATFIRTHAPQQSKIIASSYNNAALTYYSLRPDMWGATLDINEPGCTANCTIAKFEKLIKWGGQLYTVSDTREFNQNPIFLQYLNRQFPKLLETNNTVVYDLHI